MGFGWQLYAEIGQRWTKISKDRHKISQNGGKTAEDVGKLGDLWAIWVHIGAILMSSWGHLGRIFGPPWAS